MEIEHLRAVNDARKKFAKERSTWLTIMPNGIYDDFRAVPNVHASETEPPDATPQRRGKRV